MKKGLLLCSGGFSTSIIQNKLNEISKEYNITWEADGVMSSSHWKDNITDFSIILISPQIRFKFEEIKKVALDNKVKILQIQPTEYTAIAAPKLFERIKEELEI